MWTRFIVCSAFLLLSLLPCLTLSAHHWRTKKRWVHAVMCPSLPSQVSLHAYCCACTVLVRHGVDRPSEPPWQMKVMLKGGCAWRKAGNKQPDLWRTLKHTSERKGGGRQDENSKWQNGVGWIWFLSPYSAGSLTQQSSRSSFNCRVTEHQKCSPTSWASTDTEPTKDPKGRHTAEVEKFQCRKEHDFSSCNTAV